MRKWKTGKIKKSDRRMEEGSMKIFMGKDMDQDMEKNAEKNIDKEKLRKLIDIAAGRVPADLVIKNCKVVNVFSGKIVEGDIAVSDGTSRGSGNTKDMKRLTVKVDLQHLDLLTVIFILNPPMSVRKNSVVCWCRMGEQRSLQIHMRL